MLKLFFFFFFTKMLFYELQLIKSCGCKRYFFCLGRFMNPFVIYLLYSTEFKEICLVVYFFFVTLLQMHIHLTLLVSLFSST